MKKPWSISTTVRNPERIRDFLIILKSMEGLEWSKENQTKFQILLIKNRLYGYGNPQFYNGLDKKYIELLDSENEITYSHAKEILESKNYIGDGDLRGRQSFNPLEKMGFVFLDKTNKIKFTAVGNYFLEDNYDLGDVFFRSFLKWQLPNFDARHYKKEEGYNINPFISTLHFINEVNKKWQDLGENPVGISKKEFAIFIPTLINYENIQNVADILIQFRQNIRTEEKKKEYHKEFHHNYIKSFLETEDEKAIEKSIKNTIEYTDNIIRYFRLTRFIYIRGNGHYIDLEPRRSIEINSLLETFNGSALEFENYEQFVEYLGDLNQPHLPWETREFLKDIANNIIKEINELEKEVSLAQFEFKNMEKLNLNELKIYITSLRDYRRIVQEEINHKKSQNTQELKEYIKSLKEIYSIPNRALMLEKYITLGLNALNDALRIRPNYLVGDDNEPTNTAPAGKPDIECFYETFNAICEVTLLNGRDQWYNEGQPVMRHLRNFEETNSEKPSYCLFVAPNIHRDTINTFWYSVKYDYEGVKQKIIPLSINQFIELLEILVAIKESGKRFLHKHLTELYESIIEIDELNSSNEWLESIPQKIESWKGGILT
ncbi:MAG: AlwI family type II restriction endonuclease [Candidatus Woesearchaeota archaeon]